MKFNVDKLVKASITILFALLFLDYILTTALMTRGVPESNPILVFLFNNNISIVYPIISSFLCFLSWRVVKTSNSHKFKCASSLVRCGMFIIAAVLIYLLTFMEITNLKIFGDVI